MAHNGCLARRNLTEPSQVLSNPMIVQTFRIFCRRNFEQVLIERPIATSPDVDLKAARPKEQHVTIVYNVLPGQVITGQSWAAGSAPLARWVQCGRYSPPQRGWRKVGAGPV